MTELLTTKPVKPSEIPSEESIMTAARELINSTDSWKPGKTYFKIVKTVSRPAGPHNNTDWYCRISEHPPEQISFDQLWDKLAKNKPVNEKEFIPIIHKVTKVKELSPTAQIWTSLYKFPFPLSNRVFTVLQVVHLEKTTPRLGFIVSIPIDLSSKGDEDLAKFEEKGVQGSYVSVERVIQLENGNVEWRMATSGLAGGLIPQFLANMSMPKTISEDVTHFFHWFERLPK